MKKFKVWFTYTVPYVGYSEDYLIVEAFNADEAYMNVVNANKDDDNFEVQSVEEI